MTGADAALVRRRFLALQALRWLPTGLLIPVLILLLTGRGFSLTEIGLAAAAQGILVFVLELPTGGLADALGRRPVLLLATAIDIVSMAVLVTADSMPVLVVVFALQGVYRALESGPLEAWYVDAAHAADPDADVVGGLAAGGVALGLAIATGALLSGALVALGPLPGLDVLVVPVAVSIGLRLVNLVMVSRLMTENRPGPGLGSLRRSLRSVPTFVVDAVRLIQASRVLAALVLVEVFWGFGMASFEILLPPKLAEVTGGADAAAALLGPVVAVAWLASAGGAALVPRLQRRFGAPTAAMMMHGFQAVSVIAMALAAGAIGVVVGYLATYATHGAANPLYKGLLHREVDASRRATVLSAASMLGHPGGAIGAIVLGLVADSTSVSAAMVVGAVVLLVTIPLYLPARARSQLSPPEPMSPESVV